MCYSHIITGHIEKRKFAAADKRGGSAVLGKVVQSSRPGPGDGSQVEPSLCRHPEGQRVPGGMSRAVFLQALTARGSSSWRRQLEDTRLGGVNSIY